MDTTIESTDARGRLAQIKNSIPGLKVLGNYERAWLPRDLVAGLVGPTWQWTELIEKSPPGQSVIPNPEDYTLKFAAGGTFEFQADCNSGSGSYRVQGDRLVLTMGAATSLECGEGSLSDEYMTLLGEVEAYAFEGVRLLLYLQNDAGHMVFVP